jgi:hypothetical protein
MKLTSFWTQGTVFWRVFNWNEINHTAGNGDGTFRDVGSGMSWSEDMFLREKEKGPGSNILQGQRYMHGRQNQEGQLRLD